MDIFIREVKDPDLTLHGEVRLSTNGEGEVDRVIHLPLFSEFFGGVTTPASPPGLRHVY